MIVNKKSQKKNNEAVLHMMKMGYTLSTIDPEAIAFQPRPIIKKDKNALNFIHRKNKNEITSI